MSAPMTPSRSRGLRAAINAHVSTPPSTPIRPAAVSMPETPSKFHRLQAIQDRLAGSATYLGGSSLKDSVKWVRQGSGERLVQIQHADDLSPPQPALLTAVLKISDQDFFFVSDGGYRSSGPFCRSFADVKPSFVAEPADIAPFKSDHSTILANLEWLQSSSATKDFQRRGFCREDESGSRKYKFRHILFEERPLIIEEDTGGDEPAIFMEQGSSAADATSTQSEPAREDSEVSAQDPLPGAAQAQNVEGNQSTNNAQGQSGLRLKPGIATLPPEFAIENWPVHADQPRRELDTMISTRSHKLIPLPAYDFYGDIIPPTSYRSRLAGAIVEVRFHMMHWKIGNAGVDTYAADVHSLRVVSPPRGGRPMARRVAPVATDPLGDVIPRSDRKRARYSFESDDEQENSLDASPTPRKRARTVRTSRK